MTTQQHHREHSAPTHGTVASVDLLMRASALMALFGIIVIHFVQLVPTFKEMPLLGIGYVGLIGAAIVVGTRLLAARSPAVRLWTPVAALGVLALAGYAFTRMFSTPLDTQDVGNWACTLGMSALVVEGLLIAISLYAAKVAASAQSLASGPPPGSAMTPSVIVLRTNGQTTTMPLEAFDQRILDSGAAWRNG